MRSRTRNLGIRPIVLSRRRPTPPYRRIQLDANLSLSYEI